MRHIPRKRFGQNFLTDKSVIVDIIKEIQPQKNDVMIEIGPGLGALTHPLLEILNHLCVIEIDRDIVEQLKKIFPQERLTIYSDDALKFDFSRLGQQLRIIGNLPYNISTPLLFHLSNFSAYIQDMHFMLQREVVDRMVAQPSTSDYGRLSVMLQYRFEMEKLLTVSPDSFNPLPKVQSAVIRLVPINQPMIAPQNERLLSQVVTAAFAQRRKTLRNTLRHYLNTDEFVTLGIDPNMRAENLTVSQYVTLVTYLSVSK